MKIWHNFCSEIITLERVFKAWEEFSKGKKGKVDVVLFERNLEDNLFTLYELLKNKTYKHGLYKSFYIRDPKIRHIHKACVQDRVVHHAIINIIEPLFEEIFINRSYACRKDKGGFAVRSELVTVYQKIFQKHPKFYALKCDIKSYFASIDHQVLISLLKRTIKCPETINLLKKVIDSYHETPNVGIPIGNLTSQLFANVYLHPLDIFITKMVGEKNYFRYMDDFLILSPDKDYLINLRVLMRGFLKYYLKLDYHPKKNNIFRADKGVDFVGYLFKPNSITLRKKTVRRFKKRHKRRLKLLKQLINQNQLENAKILQKKLLSSKNSLRGFLKGTDYQLTSNGYIKINGIIMPPEL